MFMRDGLHLSGKGAAVFTGELSAAVDSDMGSPKKTIYLEVPQTRKEATSTHKPVTKYPENISEAGYKCVCLNARSIVNTKNELNFILTLT